MPEQLLFTKFLNHALAGPVTAMLRALHIEPKFPQAPIPNFVAMEVLVFGFLIVVFLSLIPIGVPVLFVGLHIGVAFIQAYVFVLLTTVYLAGAVASDH